MMNPLAIGSHAALTLRGISKAYGATLALDGVDLTIERGQALALMGANGAGKSTLAKIAAGVTQPDAGEIFLGQSPLRLTSPLAAHQAGIITVHQSTELLGVASLSVAENLILGELCGGSFGLRASARRMRARAATVAAGIDLDLPLDRQFSDLGPAQRQLVAIARAAATDAKVLILDEPTASLAAAEADRLFDVVGRLKSRGVGVLYISHRLGDIRRIADRIVVLRNGRRVADQTAPFDLAGAIRAMIGRDLDGVGARAEGEPGRLVLQIEGARLRSEAAPFDLTLRSGEIVAVTGALGSGKSRLLRALFGLGGLRQGSVALEGAPWNPAGPAQAIAQGVFFAGEDRWRSSFLPSAIPGADIAGAIALPHRRSWFPAGIVSDSRERRAARRSIEALDIRCRDSRDELDSLSGGNQQKVVVARWQAAPCRLLLLDEPFQGVDVGARQDLVQAIRAARSNSATLIATSDVEEAVEVADVVAVMRSHTIVGRHDMRNAGAASLLSTISAVEADDLARQNAGAP
jgi:simple sugar transport system ATP-binding protein